MKAKFVKRIVMAAVLLVALVTFGVAAAGLPFPEGAMDPMLPDAVSWEVVSVEQDTTFGLFWFFLHNPAPDAEIAYCLAIVDPNMGIPVFFCWLEDGELKFLKFAGESYVWDPVSDETYNTVVGYFEGRFGIQVAYKPNC